MDTWSIVTLAIGVLSLLTNGTLLVIIYLDPLKQFRTTTSYLITTLTISDFATGGVACASTFVTNPPVTYGMFWTTILSSFFTIFFMSCERLVVVMCPLKAKQLITKRRIFIFIGANWVVSFVLGCLMGGLQPSQLDYMELSLFSFILILVLILVVIYFMIIWRTKHKSKLLPESMRTRSLRIAKREQKLTGVLFLLVTVLMVTVVPYVAAMVVFAGYRIFNPYFVPKGLLDFASYYFPVELLNFAFNPIIYAWRLPDYRHSLYFYFTRKSRHSDKAVKDRKLQFSNMK